MVVVELPDHQLSGVMVERVCEDTSKVRDYVLLRAKSADDGPFRWSIRKARVGATDCHLVAAIMGGGGHAGAAGFQAGHESTFLV